MQSNSSLMHWIAAVFVVALGVLVLGVVGLDEVTRRPVDNLTWYLLSFFIGVITSLLGVQVGAGSVAASTPVILPPSPPMPPVEPMPEPQPQGGA